MKNRGFTLIELLVVIVIIAILASLVVGLFSYATTSAKRSATKARIDTLSQACESYKVDFHRYPPMDVGSGSQNLHWYLGQSLTKTENGVPRPVRAYIDFSLAWLMNANGTSPNPVPSFVMDAWGNPIQYEQNGVQNADAFDIWSWAQDGVNGTTDDLSNWSRND